MKLAWLEFWAQIVPEMLRLGRLLFDQSQGDPEVAREAIRRIRNHAKDWYASRDANTRALEAMPPRNALVHKQPEEMFPKATVPSPEVWSQMVGAAGAAEKGK